MDDPGVAAQATAGSARRYSLRLWLALSSVLILLLVVGAVGLMAWRSGGSAIDDLAGQVQARAGAQVEEHLRSYLGNAHRVVQLMNDAVELRLVDFERPETIYSLLFRLARGFPEISYLNFGLDDGHFFGLGRVDNVSQELRIEEAIPPDLGSLRTYRLTAEGRRGEAQDVLPYADIRAQDWYARPAAAERPVWTAVYNWVDNPKIVVVSAGAPFEAARRGVAGVDLFLSGISAFLAELRVSANARSFIVERDGALVALSTSELPFRAVGGESRRIKASEARDEAIRNAYLALEQRPGGLSGITERQTFEFGDAERWYLSATPWRDERGLDWLIVVTMPERDFTEAILADALRTALMAAIAVLVAVLVALGLAGFVARQLRRVEEAAQLIADGDLGVHVEPSGFSELNRLASAFNTMAARLRDAFAQLERGQAELESEVEVRTRELQFANAQLERLAREDGLTGLANRRHFDQRLREEWLRARRGGEPLGVILCDVDHFKAYNDRYGHGPGDDALRRVATVLARNCRRAGDLAARYGGEEFALLLPGIDCEGAAVIAGGIREQIRDLAISHEAAPRGCLTMSFGVACQSAESPFPAHEQLVKAADQALYDAKAGGRDRVSRAAAPAGGARE